MVTVQPKKDDCHIPLVLTISLNEIINELLLNLGAVLQLPITPRTRI
jgi:hypothetical protein